MKEHKILLVESTKSYALLVKQEIDKIFEKVQINIVKTKKDFVDQLETLSPDLVITEYKLPSFDGLTALQLAREKAKQVPVIFLTNSSDKATVVKCMKAGAADFIIKSQINKLGNAILAALKASEKEATKLKKIDSLVSNAEAYHNMFAYNPQAMIVFELDTMEILEVNNAALYLYGYTREEFLALTLKNISPVEENPLAKKNPDLFPDNNISGNYLHLKKNGEIIDVEIKSHLINFNEKKACNMQITDITKQKKAWEALKSSDEKFHTLFDSTQDIFFHSDLEGILYEISPSVDRYLGFSREELIGNPLYSFYYDINDRELLSKKLLEMGKVTDYRIRFRTRNNEITYASINAQLVHNSKGQPDLIMGSFRDISEQTIAEKAIQKSEEKFRAIFEINSVVKLVIDPDTQQIVDANYSASRFYGYSKEKIKQMRISEITTARPEELITLYKKIRAAGYLQYETQHCCNDGSLKAVEVFATKILIAGKDFIYAIVHDISSRKEAEKQSWLLNKAIEQSPVGIMITDQHGRIEYVNPRFTKISGHSLQEIKEKKQWFLYSGNYSDKTYSEMWETVLSGIDWTGEVPAKRKNGEHYWENISISPVKNEKGQITHVVTISEDVTLKHKTWEDIATGKHKIEAADKLKLSLINNISNEVRTPLNGIIGFADMLANSEISKEIKLNYIDIIKKSSKSLLRTIDSYIDISMILSGKAKMYPRRFYINAILEEIRDEFSENCKSKDIELNIQKPEIPSDHQLNTDPEIVHKVISHLLCNAVNFTEKGTIDFGFRIRNNNPEFFVTDTGIGIESKNITSLFDYTIHSNSAANRGYETTGLGLPIARGLVELLGGKIFAEKGKTRGTTVYFSLPEDVFINAVSEEIKEKVKPKFPILTKNSIILVAEDDDYNYKFVETVLSRADFRVIRAENGVEAVNICYNNPDIQLVLMDLKMPVMGGIEATRQIKKFLPNLPVIALTAFVSPDDEHEAFLSGCEEYIKKPVDSYQLLHSIGDLMEHKAN